MKKINEIFYSLQGEGYHTGTPAIFIRFSGCNLRCSFCDTSHNDGEMLTDTEIISRIGKFPCRMVVLTGGEPGMWVDSAFVDALHEAGKYVTIETNGTFTLPENIDWITCSPKEGAPLKLKRADEIKVVYTGKDVSEYLGIPAGHYFLQPCSCENTDEVIEYIKRDPRWRLSLQTHKLIDIP